MPAFSSLPWLLPILPHVTQAAYLCFWPDGSHADNVIPCGLTRNEESTIQRQCCGVSDLCTTNGLCKTPTGWDPVDNVYVRGACTDADWAADACPKYCYNEDTDDDAAKQSRNVIACEDLPNGNTKYCCLYQESVDLAKNPYICCNDSTRVFEAAPAAYFAGAQVMTSWPVNPVSPTNTQTSTVAAAAGPKASQGLSSRTKIGIGVGVTMTAIILILVAVLLWRWRIKRTWAAPNMKANVETRHTELFSFSETKISSADKAIPTSPVASDDPGSGRQGLASFEIHVEDPRIELPTDEHNMPEEREA